MTQTRDSLPDVRIRLALHHDEHPVRDLGQSAFGEVVGRKVGDAVRDVGSTTGILGGPPTHSIRAAYWVAESRDGRLLGIIGLYSPRWIGSQTLYLGWYCVRPDMQGKGLGKALFEHALQEATHLGARAIMVETSPDPVSTVTIYVRLGFVPVCTVPDYWEDGSPLLLMRLPICATTNAY